MEVKEPSTSYLAAARKQTEIGAIPVDWEVAQIGDLISDMRGGAPLKPSDFIDGGVKVLPKGAVGRTGWLQIREKDLQFCSPTYAARHIRNQVDPGYTIVVLRDLVPSGPSIGLIVRIQEDETFVLAQGVYGFRATDRVVPGYLVHLSNTNWYRKLANSIMVGSTQVHITNTAFKKARIPLPPTQEQESISNALDETDALISSLERLLTKKRQIKQGAMQELLTGKRRLPGFTSTWTFRRIGSFAPLQRGFDLPSRSRRPGLYPVVYSNGILNFHNAYQAKGPGVVTGRSGTIGSVTFVEQDYWPHNTALWVTHFNASDPRFVFYLFQFIGLERFATGSGVPTLNRNDVHAYSVLVPNTVEEQAEIASVLSDMDSETTVVEARLAKARAVKQAMAQALLTGRIRLVEPTA